MGGFPGECRVGAESGLGRAFVGFVEHFWGYCEVSMAFANTVDARMKHRKFSGMQAKVWRRCDGGGKECGERMVWGREMRAAGIKNGRDVKFWRRK